MKDSPNLDSSGHSVAGAARGEPLHARVRGVWLRNQAERPSRNAEKRDPHRPALLPARQLAN